MSKNKTSNEAVVTAYKDAPARKLTAGGVTYAYRELGPKGGIPVIFFVHPRGELGQLGPAHHRPNQQTSEAWTFETEIRPSAETW